MQLFKESILLSSLLVAGVGIMGLLVKEIYVMRRQLKIETGSGRRSRRPGRKA